MEDHYVHLDEGKTSASSSMRVPTHMQHIPSFADFDVLMDSDSEGDRRSRSSGREIDMELLDEVETTLSVHEMACTQACTTNLKEYVEDLELISHAAGEDLSQQKGHQELSTVQKWRKLSWPLVLFVVLGVLLLYFARGHLFQFLSWLEHLPWAQSLLVFVILFTLVSFPFGFGYIILNLMCGYLYGFVQGQITVMISVAIGITISLLLCRSCFKDYARNIITSNALQAVIRVVEGPHGFKVIFLTRFTPIPFGLQNVLFAMTRVSYPVCIAASVSGLLPTQILNTYMGSTVRNMQEVLADRVDGYIVLTAQIIVSIFLVLYLLRKARSELAKLSRPVDIETGDLENR